MAFGIVIAKPVLNNSSLIWATTIRLLAANVTLAGIILISSHRRTLVKMFIPSKDWKLTLPGSILGAYLAMMLWIAGYKYTQASIASILGQTVTIFAIILAAIFLKEEFTPRKLLATILAMTGILMVTLFRI